MPKATKENDHDDESRIEITTQAELKAQKAALSIPKRGNAVKELHISFSTADHNDKSNRAPLIAALLKHTPNLKKLTLNFSGHLHSYRDCLGDELLDALCNLTKLEEFHQGATNSARTDFGQYELMRLVSSWPKLKILYLAGDSNGDKDEKLDKLPPATCKLQSVTFERCMANYPKLAPMFAGSTHSLKHFEAWTMGYGGIDATLLPILPGLETLKLGGIDYPSPNFIREHLSRAPRLQSIQFRGDTDHQGTIRRALAKALNPNQQGEEANSKQLPFPALHDLSYPAERGTYKTGRGPNVRVHEYENAGEEELLAAVAARGGGLYASQAYPLEYKVEGAQRRAGFAAMGRRGFW